MLFRSVFSFRDFYQDGNLLDGDASAEATGGRFFTFELSVRKDHKLVTSGPYAVVRHPGYTGLTMCVVGVALSLIAPGSWIMECSGVGNAVVYPAVVLGGAYLLSLVCRRIAEEDEVLRREFGGEWEAWRAKVPYKLIPGAY